MSAVPDLDQLADRDHLARVTAEVDWESVLPPRAKGAVWRFSQWIKRAVDLAGGLILLVMLAPFFLVVAALVVLDTGFPVLYPWRVVGRRGRLFTGYKFRTMVKDADRLRAELAHLNEMSGPVFKIREDPRITRVGRFLRRYSIDELPQLWSVVKGDMSLVGPRPMFPHEFAQCPPRLRRKLAVKPGITCLWQISGRSEINDFEEWVGLDLVYIRDWSLKLDLAILIRTLVAVTTGRGAH